MGPRGQQALLGKDGWGILHEGRVRGDDAEQDLLRSYRVQTSSRGRGVVAGYVLRVVKNPNFPRIDCSTLLLLIRLCWHLLIL